MAARLNTRQAESVKTHIQTTQLVKRLQEHALEDKEMTRSQIDAARILLKKTLPDLAVTAMTGPDGEALAVQFVVKGG